MQKRDGGIKHTHTQPRTYCSRARTWRERGRNGEWRDLSFWTRGREGQACQEPHGRTDKCVEHAAASSQWWLVMIKLVKVLVPHMYVTLKQTNKPNVSSFKPGLYQGSPRESPDKESLSEIDQNKVIWSDIPIQSHLWHVYDYHRQDFPSISSSKWGRLLKSVNRS